MLNLAEPTRPEWFDSVVNHLDLLLIDHAHLEKRAASTALSMIFHYTGMEGVPRGLSDVVQEEMEHFTRMLDLLEKREIELIRLDPAPYAKELVRAIRTHEPERFLDRMLVAALIEARSCERFSVLAERLDDPELVAFYSDLFESEARHYTLYTGIARLHFSEEVVKTRLQELARLEVEALKKGQDLPRLHSY